MRKEEGRVREEGEEEQKRWGLRVGAFEREIRVKSG